MGCASEAEIGMGEESCAGSVCTTRVVSRGVAA